jgi:hypothetical protein
MSGWGAAPTAAQLAEIQPQAPFAGWSGGTNPGGTTSGGFINTAQDLSALGLTGSPSQNSDQQFAYSTLGPQTTDITGPDGGFQGTQQTSGPAIPSNYGTGLDLSTLQGLDTLAERWAYQDPNAGWVTPGGSVSPALATALNTDQSGIQSSFAYAPWEQSIIPDPSNGLFAAGPGGAVTATPGNQDPGTFYSQYLQQAQGQDTGPPMGAVLGLAGAFLAPVGAALGAGAGALGAGVDAAATDIGTSDLGALTAGAGDAGGTALATGAGSVASDLGGTLGLLDPSVQAGIQGADVASAVAGGADPATALTASGLTGLTSNFGDVLGLLPGDVQVGLQGADAASAIAAGGDPGLAAAGVGDVVADVSGLAGGIGAGGAYTTAAQVAGDPTVLSGADPGNVFLGASSSDTTTAPSGFFSDLTSGNFGNLGQEVGNLFSSDNVHGGADLVDSSGNYILPPPDPNGLAVDASGNIADATSIPQAAIPATGAGQGFWGGLGTKLATDLSDPLKLLGLGASGIGLGLNLEKAKQSNPIPGMSNIQSTANQLSSEGTQLQSYLNSGTLPQGVQAALNQATQSAIQAVRSNFASRGIAPGSTMEQQQIAAIQQNAAAQGGQLALNLLTQGVQMSDLSAQLYSGLGQTNVALNQQTEQSISNLVAALAGGGNRITIQGTQAVA